MSVDLWGFGGRLEEEEWSWASRQRGTSRAAGDRRPALLATAHEISHVAVNSREGGALFFPSSTLVYNSWWLSIRPDIDVNTALFIEWTVVCPPPPFLLSLLFFIDRMLRLGPRRSAAPPLRRSAGSSRRLVSVRCGCVRRGPGAHCSISAARRAAWLGHPSRRPPRAAAARAARLPPLSRRRRWVHFRRVNGATRAAEIEAYF